MRTEETGSEIQHLLEIALRRKWAILVPFLAIFFVVAFFGLYLPNLYRSTATILIEPQKIPTEYVRSTITTDPGDRLRTITQQMGSRTRLLKVIEELDLYPKMVDRKVPSEVMVTRMRKDLDVEVQRGSGDSFQVSYVHPEPKKAMLAVSRLVSLFIEDSLRIREEQAQGTTIFIEEELQKLKKVLEEQEAAIRRYKSAYMGELPDQLDANLRMLDNLQLQLASNLESQRETEDRLMLIQRDISRLEEGMMVRDMAGDDAEAETMTDAALNELLRERDEQRRRVASLAGTFTERHPDLIAARRELARLEERLKVISESMASAPKKEERAEAVISPSPALSMELTNLRRQYNEIKPRLSALEQEEKDLRARIAQYQQRVEAAPQREQRIIQLTRDYENTKASYEGLLDKKLEATLSENLEKRQQGENFHILDPANFPEKPFLPNRKKIIAAGFAGGMASGFGLAFLLEIFFPAFYSLKQLKNLEEFPIVLGIPYISSSRERWKKGKRALVGAGVTLFTIVVALILVNRFLVPLDQVVSNIEKNLKGIM